jgi:hypothetical protein
MQPATLAEDNPNDRHQPSTSSIHMSPLVLQQKKRPIVDPVRSFVNNLQKLSMTCLVKNNIITAIPNCPHQFHTCLFEFEP